MKSYNNLYEKLLDKELIKQIIIDASKGKRYRKDVRQALLLIDYHVNEVYKILETESFISPKHTPKIINEHSCKKTRTIICPHFLYEQIIHHLVIHILKPIFERHFYKFSIASQPNKGISYGKKVMSKWLRKANRKYDGKLYILKLDIKHFFENINRNVLKQKLRRILRDTKFYKLVCKIIDYDLSLNGIPLGFYTSQWFANFYLTSLDYFIKHELKADYYMRYMDDIVIIYHNKNKLHRIFTKVKKYLKNELKLDIKQDWQIFRWSYLNKQLNKECGRCLDFIGFQFRCNRIILRKSTLQRLRKTALNIAKRWRYPFKMKLNWYHICQFISRRSCALQAQTRAYYRKYIKGRFPVNYLIKQYICRYSQQLFILQKELEENEKKYLFVF